MPRRYGQFGYAPANGQRFLEPDTQEGSLRVLADLTNNASVNALVRATALKIVRNCAGRDDVCELEAIYNAVKNGDPDVEPLKDGFKYVADPRYADYFVSPVDTLKMCLKGACGSDCDDHVTLVCSLMASLGYKVGLRAWGPKNSGGFVHVYAVCAFPKRPPWSRVIAMDTTVPEFEAGDEPPRGDVLTAWLA